MPKRSRTKKAEDENEIAARIVHESTSDPLSKPKPATPRPKKNPAAVELGRLGGLKGGPARARALTDADRARIAKLAARARWKRHRKG